MKFGLPVSLALHTVIIGASLIALGGPPQKRDGIDRPIPVTLVDISELTVIPQRPRPEPKTEPAPEPETPEATPQPDDPEPQPEAPEPEIKPDPKPKDTAEKDPVTAEDKPDQAAENTPDDTPDDMPEDKPKKLSLGDITQMANNTADNFEDEGTPKTTQSEQNKAQAANAGADSAASTSFEDAVMMVIYNQWTIPAGAPDMESLVVSMRVELSITRRVKSVTLSEASERAAKANPYYKTAAERAVRAVYAAEPYDFLPRAQYDKWQILELTFYPKNASGISEN